MHILTRIFIAVLCFSPATNAGPLDELNSKVNAVNSITDGASRIKSNTVDKYARSESNDKKRLSEWKSEIKTAEKAMAKACKKTIKVEFEPERFKNFLASSSSPGAFCADAFKVLEYDLCPELNYRKKVASDISAVKCMYTTKSDVKLKMKIIDKVLMIGYGENTAEIYDEANLWFRNRFLK